MSSPLNCFFGADQFVFPPERRHLGWITIWFVLVLISYRKASDQFKTLDSKNARFHRTLLLGPLSNLALTQMSKDFISLLVWYYYFLNSGIRKTIGMCGRPYCKVLLARKYSGILGTCIWGLHARFEEHFVRNIFEKNIWSQIH